MIQKIKGAAYIVLGIIATILIVAFIQWAILTQEYVQNSKTTATKGILFTTTLNLDVYKNVSSGYGWLGKFDRYSRSDRHEDVLTIYCNDYCKGK